MAYTKPTVIAQNSAAGSYAAGCPASKHSPGCSHCNTCISCEVSY